MGMRNFKQFLFLLTVAPVALGAALAKADTRVGHNRDYIVVEASQTDCRIDWREEDFLEAAEKFAKLMFDLQKQFPGEWKELSDDNQKRIREELNSAIRKFYDEQYKDFNKPIPTYGSPDLPSPAGLDSESTFEWKTLRPSAFWFMFHVPWDWFGKLKAENMAKSAMESLEKVATELRRPLPPVNAGASIQLGLIAAPLCVWKMPKSVAALIKRDGKTIELDKRISKRAAMNNAQRLKDLRLSVQNLPGEFSSGFFGFEWDVEPFMLVNVKVGAGTEVGVGKRTLWQKLQPSLGLVWGDVDFAADVAGVMTGLSMDVDFRLPFNKIPPGLKHWGSNWKGGCIHNDSYKPRFEIPYCSDFAYIAHRLEPLDGLRAKNDRFNLTYNGKLNVGIVSTGGPAIETLLTWARRSPESIQKTLKSLDWIIDTPKRYVPVTGRNGAMERNIDTSTVAVPKP